MRVLLCNHWSNEESRKYCQFFTIYFGAYYFGITILNIDLCIIAKKKVVIND